MLPYHVIEGYLDELQAIRDRSQRVRANGQPGLLARLWLRSRAKVGPAPAPPDARREGQAPPSREPWNHLGLTDV